MNSTRACWQHIVSFVAAHLTFITVQQLDSVTSCFGLPIQKKCFLFVSRNATNGCVNGTINSKCETPKGYWLKQTGVIILLWLKSESLVILTKMLRCSDQILKYLKKP